MVVLEDQAPVDEWMALQAGLRREGVPILMRGPLNDNDCMNNPLAKGLIEDDELFLLPHKAPRTYAIIPSRAFISEEAKAEFRDLVRRKVTQPSA